MMKFITLFNHFVTIFMSVYKKVGIAVLCCILLLMSYAFILFQYPSIESLEEVQLYSLKQDEMEVEILVKINNPNWLGATFTGLDAKIHIDGHFLGVATSTDAIKISANGSSELRLKTKVDIKSFAKIFPVLMKKKSESVVEVKGIFRMAIFFRDIELAMKSKGNIDMRKQLKETINKSLVENAIQIKKIAPKSVSLGSSELSVVIELKNQLPFSYTLQSVNVNIYNDQGTRKLGDWKQTKIQRLAPGGKVRLSGNVAVQNLSILSQIGGIFTKRKADVKVLAKGKAVIDLSGNKFSIPVQQSISLSKALL